MNYSYPARSLALLLTLAACGGDGDMSDTGTDTGTADVGMCSAADCDDGLYCNGVEQCAPGDPGAGPDGCVAGTAPCSGTETCEEATSTCAPACADEDGDGHTAAACGGTDCDDADGTINPDAVEACDGVDADCSGTPDDASAIGSAIGCPATDCVDIRDNNPASADGTWWVQPGPTPFEVYCDQTTEGGGWAVVYRNHGGAVGGEESNATLFGRAGGLGDGAIAPHDATSASAINAAAWSAWWSSTGREWMKTMTLWDSADAIENEQYVVVTMNGVSMSEVFSAPASQPCTTASDSMSVVANGVSDMGSTNLINSYQPGSATFGLANTGNAGADNCGADPSNLIDDPEGDDLYNLDGPDRSLNTIRHLFSYDHNASGQNASRCVYACWDATNQGGHYDGFTWMVR